VFENGRWTVRYKQHRGEDRAVTSEKGTFQTIRVHQSILDRAKVSDYSPGNFGLRYLAPVL
jgi:hypothetical protein